MRNPNEFESRLKNYIERSGRSQAKTAKMLGYHPSTLTKWVQGTNQIPFAALRNLCELVGVSETEQSDLFLLAGYDVSNLMRAGEQLPLIREFLLANTELQTFEKSGFEQRIIELYIQDLSEPTYLRLAALKAYIMNGLNNQAVFNSLITDPDPTIRQAMLRHVYRNPNPNNEIQFQPESLERLIFDEVSDVAVEAIKAIRHLVTRGKIPPNLLTAAKTHRYWLVRKIAIRDIASIDTPDVLDLLYEFRTTSYHVSQQIIRDFIQRHYRNFNEDQLQRAVEIVEGLKNAKFVSDISKHKNEALLDELKGNNPMLWSNE